MLFSPGHCLALHPSPAEETTGKLSHHTSLLPPRGEPQSPAPISATISISQIALGRGQLPLPHLARHPNLQAKGGPRSIQPSRRGGKGSPIPQPPGTTASPARGGWRAPSHSNLQDHYPPAPATDKCFLRSRAQPCCVNSLGFTATGRGAEIKLALQALAHPSLPAKGLIRWAGHSSRGGNHNVRDVQYSP